MSFSTQHEQPSVEYLKNWANVVSSCILGLYYLYTLGPILYLVFSSHFTEVKPFPTERALILTSVLISFFATVMFFISRFKGYAFDKNFVLLTLLIYMLSLSLLYPVLAFKHQQSIDPTKSQKEEQDDEAHSRRHGEIAKVDQRRQGNTADTQRCRLGGRMHAREQVRHAQQPQGSQKHKEEPPTNQ